MKFRLYEILVVLILMRTCVAQENYFLKCMKLEGKKICENSAKVEVKKVKSDNGESFYCIEYDSYNNDSYDPKEKIVITFANDQWSVVAKGLEKPIFDSTQFKFQAREDDVARLVFKQKNRDVNLPAIKSLIVNGIDVCSATADTVPIRQSLDDFFTDDVSTLKRICGERPESDVNKLIIGTVTDVSAWPWQAIIYALNPKTNSYFHRCGGVLINERTIITAALCVDRSNVEYSVSLGKNEATFEMPRKDLEVDQILLHPDYYSGNLSNNIALMKLKNVKYTTTIQPVCLPDKNDLDIGGKEGKLVGFGYDENGMFNQHLKEATMITESYIKCLQRQREFYKLYSISNSFCAASVNGEGICKGDTGSGFFLRNLDGQYYLYGLASFGPIEFEINRICKVKGSGNFVHVVKYMEWITGNWF